MEAKYWFYIIVGGVYVLSRFLKKPETPAADMDPKDSNNRNRRPNNAGQEKPKALTFEELLQQITEAKQAPKPAPVLASRPVAETQYREFDYDDDLKDEAEDLEDIKTDYKKENKVFETYEEGKRSAFNRRSLEETLNVQNTDMKFGKFKAFEIGTQRNLLEEYTKQFQDPEGLRKAIVMSEILNRKF
jgi:hypothetical protein